MGLRTVTVAHRLRMTLMRHAPALATEARPAAPLTPCTHPPPPLTHAAHPSKVINAEPLKRPRQYESQKIQLARSLGIKIPRRECLPIRLPPLIERRWASAAAEVSVEISCAKLVIFHILEFVRRLMWLTSSNDGYELYRSRARPAGCVIAAPLSARRSEHTHWLVDSNVSMVVTRGRPGRRLLVVARAARSGCEI